MIIALLCIFCITVSASYAADTNSNTATIDDQSPVTQATVQSPTVNTVGQSSNSTTSSSSSSSSSSGVNTGSSNVISSTNGNASVSSSSSSSSTTKKTTTSVKAAGEIEKLSQSQILAASKTVNSYINKYKKLPNYVTIAGYKFSMQEYMYMLSKTIYYKYNKKTTQITIKYNIKNPASPSGVTIKGKLTKAQYYTYSKNIINYINKYNKIPNYVSTKLGKMQYQTAVYTLNKVLYYSATHSGVLASTVSVSVGKTHTLNKNLPKYERTQTKTGTTSPTTGTSGTSGTTGTGKTISQSLIWSASSSVKTYVDKNGKLPNYVTISGNKYSMPEFLYLLSKSINTRIGGSTGAIAIKSGVKNPTKPSGATISKTFTKAQYNDMAKRMVNYINSYNKAPNCLAAKYGAGDIQYQTAIYGLSCVGNYINTKKAIPSSLTIKVAKTHSMNKYLPVYSSSPSTNTSTPSNGTNTNTNSTTNSTTGITTTVLGSNDKGKVELIGVFGNKNAKIKIAYVIGQHPLESQVHNVLYNLMTSKKNNLNYCYYIYKITVTKNPSDYSEGRMNGQLLAQSYVLPHIISNNYNLVIDIHSNQGMVGGNYEKTQFIFAPLNHTTSKKIAEDIIGQIAGLSYYYPASQTSPPYLTEPLVKAGIPTIIFETYRDEDISITNNLVTQLITKVDGYNFAGTSTDTTGTISLANIMDAASRVKAYVETNGVLPNVVTIGTTQYSMPNFLYLLSTAIKNMGAGSTSGVKPITVSGASSPSGAKIAGTLTKANYLDVATRVSNYITSNKQAPNYASSALGNIQFQSLVYELSKVLNYANSNGGILPNTLTINTSNPSKLNGGSGSSDDGSGSSGDMSAYLKATTRCQVNDASIQALAKKLTNGLTTDSAKATAIFNYVRDNIDYRLYWNSYDSTGAKGVLTKGWANCVDTTHLVIALSRAAGIAARYVNADNCVFSTGVFGHVWAEIYIDGKWVIADATSTRNSLGVVKNWNTNTGTIKGKYAEITF